MEEKSLQCFVWTAAEEYCEPGSRALGSLLVLWRKSQLDRGNQQGPGGNVLKSGGGLSKVLSGG